MLSKESCVRRGKIRISAVFLSAAFPMAENRLETLKSKEKLIILYLC